MLKWIVGWLVDILLALVLVSLVLGYLAVMHPERFPQPFSRHVQGDAQPLQAGVALPSTQGSAVPPLDSHLSAAMPVQR